MGKREADIDKLLRETEALLRQTSKYGGKKTKFKFSKFKKPKLSVPIPLASKKQVSILLFIVAAILVVVLIISFMPGTECDTKECFIEKANNCELATYEFTVETANIRIESHSDCSFTKKILSLKGSEVEAVKNLFEGTSMTCDYAAGGFDQNYVNMISGNLDNCYGTLADAVISVT